MSGPGTGRQCIKAKKLLTTNITYSHDSKCFYPEEVRAITRHLDEKIERLERMRTNHYRDIVEAQQETLRERRRVERLEKLLKDKINEP